MQQSSVSSCSILTDTCVQILVGNTGAMDQAI